jgi:hypothetical protein
MEQKLGPQDLARFSPIDSAWVFPAISFHVSLYVIMTNFPTWKPLYFVILCDILPENKIIMEQENKM